MKVFLFLPCILLTSLSHGQPGASPSYVIGDLNVDRSTISQVAGPDLEWRISHPQSVPNLVRFDPSSGALVTLKEVRIQAFVVGIGKQGLETAPRISFWTNVGTGGAWALAFDGTPLTQQSSKPVFDEVLSAQSPILLGGRAYGRTSWMSATTLRDGPLNVLAGSKGEIVPTTISGNAQGFLSPYLDEQEGNPGTYEWTCGATEMLFCFALPSDERGGLGTDLQNLVVLLRFTSI